MNANSNIPRYNVTSDGSTWEGDKIVQDTFNVIDYREPINDCVQELNLLFLPGGLRTGNQAVGKHVF